MPRVLRRSPAAVAPLAALAVASACSAGTPTRPAPTDDDRAARVVPGSPPAAPAGTAGAVAAPSAKIGTPPASGVAPAAVASPAAAAGLVDVVTVIPDVVLDLRYATADNFTHHRVYPVARCLLLADVADRLADAAATLRADGLRLVMWDCYRPASVQRALWALVPDPRYVAEPRFDAAGRPTGGSAHSRGAAVDVSLADADGAPLAMPTDHDAFGPAAHRDHPAADPAIRARLGRLDRAMTSAGFEGLATEWWHYGAAGAGARPLLDAPLAPP